MISTKSAEILPHQKQVSDPAQAVIGTSQGEDRIEDASQLDTQDPAFSEESASSPAPRQTAGDAKQGKKSSPAKKPTAVKKAPAKKSAKSKKDGTAAPSSPSDTTPTESGSGEKKKPSPSTEEKCTALEGVKKSASGIEQMTISSVEKEINKACKQSEKQSLIAQKSSTLVVTYAWVTGKLLNQAKSLLRKQGQFGNWRKKHLVETGLMSVKTSQRYMDIARKWASIDELLEAAPNLWTAYQRAGVLAKPDKDEETGKKKQVEVWELIEQFASGCSNLQRGLRHLVEIKSEVIEKNSTVPDVTQMQFDLMADEIIQFATSLRGTTV